MSTKTHPEDPRTSLPPSVVILGNDAQLAARPATPVQLAHACLAAGYRAVVPASWGDELIATATMHALATRDVTPAIHCACPHVARRVLAVGSDLSPYLVSFVSPPAAAARYVRQNSPGGVRITFVGRCPGAGDDAIDARLTPEELLAQLTERGIRLIEQPLVFDSVIPPDRRRHHSQPGGLPSPEALWSDDRPTTVEVVSDADLVAEIAEKVLAGTNSLLDLALAVGCACAGAVHGAFPHTARAAVVALEPPRAPAPVIDEQFATNLELPLPGAARSSLDIIAAPVTDADRPPSVANFSLPLPDMGLGEPTPPRRPRFIAPQSETPVAAPTPPRRKTPGPTNRVIAGSMPLSSDSEGRVLPRAYVARRRSPRSGIPAMPESPASVAPASPPSSATPELQHATPRAAPAEVVRGESRVHDEPTQPKDPRETSSVSQPDSPVEPRVDPSVFVSSAYSAPRHVGRQSPPAVRSDPPREIAWAAEQQALVGMVQPPTAHASVVDRIERAPTPPIPPIPAVGPTISGEHSPPGRSTDTELPIVQSIEPPRGTNGRGARAVVQPLPMIVDQVRRTTERVSGEVRAIAERRPRTTLLVAVATFVLLGVAIGYASARGLDRTTGGEAGGQLDDAGVPAVVPGAGVDSLHGGSRMRDSSSRRSAVAPTRRARTNVRRPARNSQASGASPAPPPQPSDSTGTLTPPPGSADSAARAAAQATARARSDSATTEREALRLELERRRARIDSIARRVQELKPQ